ncbi:ATP-binding cassette domain-containing protein [Piscinibacter sakaiensis]|uniref:ATP-binding cassette domain-containing protein n=1 Tax=Piscinibacter sakaiensis TaxID=1547922 RepID=UPI003AAADCCF
MTLITTVMDGIRLLCQEADRPTCWRLAATTLAITAASALSAAAPLALKHLIDALATPGLRSDLAAALVAGALYALALTASRILAEIRPWLTGAIEQKLSAGVRLRCFAHLMRLPLAFHLQQRSGSLMQTINQATVGTRMLMMATVGAILPVLIEIAFIIVILGQLTQPALVGCILLSSLVYVGLFAHEASLLSRRSGAVVQATVRTHGVLADYLCNVEAIKCNNAAGLASRQLADATVAERSLWSMLHRQRARMGVSTALVFGMAVAACLFLSGQAVAAGTLTLGGFVLANVYILQIIRPLEALGAGVRDLVQAAEWIRPILKILQTPPEGPRQWNERLCPASVATDPMPLANSAPGGKQAPSLRARGLTFAHQSDRKVLEAIDFDIGPGRTLAIVGASGSGKSSLIRLILRLHEPQAGHILLDGTPIDTLAPDQLRGMIAFVPQDTLLLHDTIAANIALGVADAPPGDILHAATLAGLGELIESLPEGSDTLVGERGLRLSGGERQRVAIARAVLRGSRLLLFDEATSMLDSATEETVMRNIRQASDGCTTVIVAHRLSTVAHADEIIVLDRGVVVERGRHGELLAANGHYARVWAIQNAPPKLAQESGRQTLRSSTNVGDSAGLKA